MHLVHLGSRFFKSLSSKRPPTSDADWLASFLQPSELLLWESMSAPDQRHSVEVARNVKEVLVEKASPPVLAAAALHDVGKVKSGFGTLMRVGATVVWAVLPDKRASDWLPRSGFRGRLAQYRMHPDIGAQLLDAAGSDPLTIAWAAEHHSDPTHWTVEPAIANVLKSCDDD